MTAPALALLRPETPWDWTLLADCQYTDPEAFFPEIGGSAGAAKKICAGCPVRTECLEFALEHGIRDGIWGGTTERQRRALAAARPARSVPAGPAWCRKGLHLMDGRNTGSGGRCLACQRASAARIAEQERAARTGDPTPRPGRSLAA